MAEIISMAAFLARKLDRLTTAQRDRAARLTQQKESIRAIAREVRAIADARNAAPAPAAALADGGDK